MEDKENTGNIAVKATDTSTKAAKKPAKRKPKTQQEKASHPPTGEMVNTAIKELKDRKGSSLQAIKKYVTSGASGASGSFKLSTGKVSETSTAKRVSNLKRKSVPKKTHAVAKATPIKAKKAATEKETATVRKGGRKAVAKPKAATAVKNISKTMRNTKAPAAKTKTLIPKKVGASRTVRSSPKK